VSAAFDRILAALEAADCRQGGGWLCPAHEDRHASLSVTEGEDGRVLAKCFAGCEVEQIVAAIGLTMRDLFDDRKGGASGSVNRATAQRPGCTVEQYAAAKRLPVAFLRSLGISDYVDNRWSERVLRVPYRDPEGHEAAVRLRTSVAGDVLWRKGSKPFLYGLWRQGLRGCAVDGGHDTPHPPQVVLVEGESDCHTLWHHGIPALGLPGASGWRESRDAVHLRNFGRVSVVIEPDQGGEAVLGWLAESSIRDRAWLVEVDGHKDPSALHVADPDRFQERWRAAIDAAEPWRERAAKLETAERRETWAKCAALAREPRILDRLVADAERAGVTGEAVTVQVVYLVLVARLLDRLASIVVKGQSSSGKSHVVQTVVRFLPPTASYEMTAASEHALIYDDEPLAHRVLVIYEASGLESEKFSYIVRSLLSEGRLRYPTVTKRAGELKTVIVEREGPTALITTTTAVRLHAENETRMLSLASDESTAQTAEVLQALADDFEPWHALSRWLELGERRVTIPFAKRLAELVPPVAVRLRRDFGAVLALIRAHALLHQARRSRDVKGRIVAEIEDYAIVRGLLADVVSQGVERTVKPEVRELVAKVGELMSESEEVTQRQLADALDLDKASVSRWVRATLDAGYLVNREDRKGRRHRLVTGDPLPDDLEILPSPELVAPLATPEQEAKAERLSRVDLSDDPGAT
jgi:DNA-binding transcriptional ArsR family regulator